MKRLILIISLLSLWAGAFEASARYRGDLNGDDRVDLADMVYLAKAIKAGSTDKALDINASGSVDDHDLQRLADIIISGNLNEDSGLNVGIGGWDDAGEDFGGTVKAPAFITRSAEETRFYMRNPKSEGNDRCSMEFGVSEGNEAPSAIFFNVRLPRELEFDQSRMVELENSILATHRLYGSPKFKKENEDDEWSDYSLRFIVMSPDLKPLPLPEGRGKLGSVHFTPGDCWGSPIFANCQIALPNSDGCTYIEEHWADYNGSFRPVEISSVWFDQAEMTLTAGDEGWLYANIDPWDATDQNLVWTSSDESVATVSSEDGRNATVRAVKGGETVISATASNGVSASCRVTVEERFVDVWGIYLDRDNIEMTEGDAVTITATIDPEEATDKTITWSSSNESVAVVNGNGAEATVTALAPGYVEIYASASNGITAVCYVTVSAKIIEATEIILSTTAAEMKVGETVSLTANVIPENTTDKTVVWSSTNEGVATVDASGNVTANALGEATITATCGNATATCNVTVVPTPVESITLSNSSLSLTEGETATLTATVSPSDATDKTVTWTSSDESVASVSPQGVVSAKMEGTATITATSTNGKTAICTVTVKANIISVTGISISDTELNLTEGETMTLTATVSPSDATDKTVTWTSSDESVATVSASGEVTAVKAGSATITAASSNGMTATCIVTVEPRIIELEAIILNAEELNLEVGDTFQLTAEFIPADATYQDLEWWVDDENVATIDHNGLITMINEGETFVHVRSAIWNEIEAVCHLNVSAGVFELIEKYAPCDIYTTSGILVKKGIHPSEIESLPHGIYIIHQRGKTSKFLK